MSHEQRPASPVGGRRQRAGADSSDRHPPHVTVNDDGADYQAETPERGDVPGLPANASGHDRVGTDEHPRTVDEESMYDRRPSQDKDRPPSTGAS